MRRIRRNSSLSDDLRGSLALERGERVLTHAQLTGGGAAVATDRALHLVEGPPGEARAAYSVPWHQILRARWLEDDGALLVELSVPGSATTTRRLELEEASLLPETVRERVMASIVVSRQVSLRGRPGARVVGRRVPGSQALEWQVVREPGAGGEDLDARIEAALGELKEQTGG